jgi:two-component system sensor histidine kinase RegB
MNQSLLAAQTGHTQLRRLFWLRNVAIAAQCVMLLLVYRFLSADLAWAPMLAAVAGSATLNVWTGWRLTRDYPVSQNELFGQLSADVIVLSVLLYFGGGSTNPFVSLYLLPLVIAAATLSRRLTWAMAAFTLACYSLLMVWYVPLPDSTGHNHASPQIAMTSINDGHQQHDHAAMVEPPPPTDYCRTEPETSSSMGSILSDAFNTHVLGMWLGFFISAVVVAYFVVEMARAVRLRDAELNRAREETLRNERIVALGTQAASAAHELGTPLSTLAVLIGEMRHDANASQENIADFNILDEQVRNCKRILDGLLSHAQEMPEEQTVDEFLRAVLNEWQLLRPTVHYHYLAPESDNAPRYAIHTSLRAALLNLLNNAADASPQHVDIYSKYDGGLWHLEIHDYGAGLTAENAARAGSAFFTTKQEGRGIGLLLANATIERLGGSVRLSNRESGGATTEIILPLTRSA